MAKYELTSPDGQRFEVSAPKGASQDDVMSYFQSQQEQPQQEQGFFDRVGESIGERALEAQEIKQRYGEGEMSEASAMLQGIGNVGFGLMGDVVGEGVVSAGRGIGSAAEAIAPETTESVKQLGQDIMQSDIGQMGLQALKAGGEYWDQFRGSYPDVARNLEAVGNIAGAVPLGGATAAVGGEVIAPAARQAVKQTGKGLMKGAVKALPKASDEMIDVGRLAQKYDIPVSVTEITGSPALINVQKLSKEFPLSGENAFRAKQMTKFNKAIFETVGEDAHKFTPMAMDKAFTNVGRKFENFGKGKTFTFDDDFIRGLSTVKDEVRSSFGKDVADDFWNEARKLLGQSDDMRGIKGEVLNKERSRINRLARKAEPSRADAYRDLENYIIEKMSASPEATKELIKAKGEYKNLLVIEPLAAKAKGGNINPTLLSNRVSKIYGRSFVRGKAGKIGELARIGSELLNIPGGSDTAQKFLTGGALVGSAFEPVTAATVVAPAISVNRAYQNLINRNPSIVRELLKETK